MDEGTAIAAALEIVCPLPSGQKWRFFAVVFLQVIRLPRIVLTGGGSLEKGNAVPRIPYTVSRDQKGFGVNRSGVSFLATPELK